MSKLTIAVLWQQPDTCFKTGPRRRCIPSCNQTILVSSVYTSANCLPYNIRTQWQTSWTQYAITSLHKHPPTYPAPARGITRTYNICCKICCTINWSQHMHRSRLNRNASDWPLPLATLPDGLCQSFTWQNCEACACTALCKTVYACHRCYTAWHQAILTC